MRALGTGVFTLEFALGVVALDCGMLELETGVFTLEFAKDGRVSVKRACLR